MNLFGKIGIRRLRKIHWAICGACLVLLSAIHFASFPPGRPLHLDSRVRGEMSAIAVAIHQYREDYNRYPQGSGADVFVLLTGSNVNGKNPRKNVYLTWREDRGFIDPWGTPYELHVSAPGDVRMKSAGKNKKFGDDDDLVWPIERSNIR